MSSRDTIRIQAIAAEDQAKRAIDDAMGMMLDINRDRILDLVGKWADAGDGGMSVESVWDRMSPIERFVMMRLGAHAAACSFQRIADKIIEDGASA